MATVVAAWWSNLVLARTLRGLPGSTSGLLWCCGQRCLPGGQCNGIHPGHLSSAPLAKAIWGGGHNFLLTRFCRVSKLTLSRVALLLLCPFLLELKSSGRCPLVINTLECCVMRFTVIMLNFSDNPFRVQSAEDDRPDRLL
jgi:hypothetical protein